MSIEDESGYKSEEEKKAAEQFEAVEGVTDTESELSESAKQAVDVAWRSEGLDKVMQQKGDRREFFVTIYTMTIFTETMPGKTADEGVLSESSKALEALCDEYDYDSGKRRFAKE